MKTVNNQKLSLGQKAVLASLALVPVLTMAAEGDGAVKADASAITALMSPIAVVGGAILTVLIAIKGWKLIRRAL
ncbi:major capsid protein [Acinetobacter johnsonii]|uniref:major capsid protein n=1 Tax=Acinetobacter johnsonii TaxID=40214 RepID=UPI0032B316F5